MNFEIYPFWNFEKCNVENSDNAQGLEDVKIKKDGIFCLKDGLQLLENTVCSQRGRYIWVSRSIMYIFKTLYPCRFTGVGPLFWYNHHDLCFIFNKVLDFIYEKHHHRLQSWKLNFLRPNFLKSYADAVAQKGAFLKVLLMVLSSKYTKTITWHKVLLVYYSFTKWSNW